MKRALSIQLVFGLVISVFLVGCESGVVSDSMVGDALPTLVGAEALSNHYVEVMFTQPAGQAAENPANYTITAPDSSPLEVIGATVSEDKTQVILATASQEPVLYVLTVPTEPGEPSDKASPTQASKGRGNTSFTGSTNPEPFLASAIALTNGSVLLTLSERMDRASCDEAAHYRIEDPDQDPDVDIRITGVDLDEDRTTVIVSTTPQDNIIYTIRVANIASHNGFLINPTRCTATFFGIAPNDEDGPRLLSAVSTTDMTVLLTFSEPLDHDAADPVNFQITCDECPTPELQVLDAFLTAHNTQVVLATHPQTADVAYTVTVSNMTGEVTDLSVNRNPIDPDPSTAVFTFGGQPAIEPAFVLPRVVGAISLSNTTVVVAFNKPMGDSALAASAYSIVQVNVNPEVGALAVLGNSCDETSINVGEECASDADCDGGTCLLRKPRFVGLDRTAVELTTTSQNEVTYEVTVVNVRDQAGNQLAPKEVLVDPSKAQFAGTPPTGSELVDSDGDGVTDNQELLGYVVVIRLTNGETIPIEVTSDPFRADTDGDGIGDLGERARFSNPRSADTDIDLILDFDEVYVWGTSVTNQDTDRDGIRDSSELNRYKTSPLFADTDGDGFDDREEIPLGNRDPRIADLPDPGISVGQVSLRLDTRFAYTDTQGESRSVQKSTSATLSQSESRTFSTSHAATNQETVQAGLEIGHEWGTTSNKGGFKIGLKAGYTRNDTFTASESSTRQTQEQFQESLTSGVSRDVSQAVTRTVVGASVQALVTINNGGDIPFTVHNIELTGLLQDPFDRSSFQPVATLLPASESLGGGGLEVSLGPFAQERGPFVFENREVFPTLVEDLMKYPRGLIFKVANFDIVDEQGRNFAFLTQDVNDRTAGLIIDFGTGEVGRYRVSTHSRYDVNECDGASNRPGAFCRSDADCPNGSCDLSNAKPVGVSMEFVLQDILGFNKNEPANAITVGPNGCGQTAAIGDDVQVVVPVCPPVEIGGSIVLPGPNGVLDTRPSGDDQKDSAGTRIIDGGDGCAHTRASRDDIQVVPARCESASPDGVMVLPGPNGVFETTPVGDDELATVTGYETELMGACDGNTALLIDPGPNAVLDTSPAAGDDTISGTTILPGANGVLETRPEGDDFIQGPGLSCNADSDCPDGTCKAAERLVRVKGVKNNVNESRVWIILSPKDIPPDVDFDDIRMQSGDEFSLAYVQDRDGDGLIAREEFLYGSSDLDDNTDGCPLGDGAPGCDPLVFDFDSVLDFDEVRKGWEIDVAGERNYFSFPNPVLPDTDADRLFDDEEQNLGTDPGKRDTDDDELQDYDEVRGYQIIRRDDTLIRNVVPYQSAIITPGFDNILDTAPVLDDALGMSPSSQSIITPGLNGVINSPPEGDDVLKATTLILDGGNGTVETVAQGDDIQIGPTPSSSSKVSVSFLDFNPGGDACDGLLPGEYHFDFSLNKGSSVIGTFTEDAVVSRTTPHSFADNSTDVFLSSDELMTLFVTVHENDPQCNVDTRRGVVEPLAFIVDGGNGVVDTVADSKDVQLVGFGNSVPPGSAIIVAGSDAVLDTAHSLGGDDTLSGAYIVEPYSGGDGTAGTEVPEDLNGNPLNDDIQEVALGDAVLPGQVIITPGPNGILDTVADGDDVIPIPNGFGDTLALDYDQQVVGLAQPTNPGQFIVACGDDGEPNPMLANAVPGVCTTPDDGPQPPYACAAVIRQPNDRAGVAETSASGDDVQLIAVGSDAAAGAVIIDPGPNEIIDSILASQVIVEPDHGDTIADAAVAAGTDDVQVAPVNSPVSAGQLIIAPGPNGILDSPTAGDDVINSSDDEFVAAFVPDGLDCLSCPLGECVFDCSVCPEGTCVGDDVLLIRSAGDSCEDGVCPCGSCVDKPFDEATFDLDFHLDQLRFLPTTLPIYNHLEIPGIIPDIGEVFPDCLAGSTLNVRLDLVHGAEVSPGAVLVRPGLDGVLDTTPMGDDVVGTPHLTLFATDPLNRDTDGDGLFDGAEVALGANPNDATDASKFRDDDNDGLANIVEDEGWFIGHSNHDGLFCRVVSRGPEENFEEDFEEVSDEFDPPFACEFVVSDRFEPDTDFDGLPDLLERLIRSDPTSEDTDGDGLLDLDEFDPTSPFSVDVGVFRQFTRLCADADRCTFSPIDEPFGTSVVLADTDGDGRDDRSEIFDSYVIMPCIEGEQLPREVWSSPLSRDADRDGVWDGEEENMLTDPQDPDTDDDGLVDDPRIDPQPDGCGKTVRIEIDSYMTGDNDCDGGAAGDGDFSFYVCVEPSTNELADEPDCVWGAAKLGRNSPFNFASNQVTYILRPGEWIEISGQVRDYDSGSGGADEVWDLGTIIFEGDDLHDGVNTMTIGPLSSGSGTAHDCYAGHTLTITITVGPA
ncbi:MAG: hypothetical protein JSU63_03520 [Phycisphaerales bacterium]|nr:MAG: hypothetical protein JSU63_03520 [Phycisphaerales bacterium]